MCVCVGGGGRLKAHRLCPVIGLWFPVCSYTRLYTIHNEYAYGVHTLIRKLQCELPSGHTDEK